MPSLWISLSERELLMAEANRASPNETGGVLLGYRGEQDAIVVTHVVGPGPLAVHTPTSFVPDHAFHDREVARIYEATDRRSAYLGDWHSHPGGGPHTSNRDRRTLRKIARSPSARAPEPLMIIVGGGPAWRLAAYRGRIVRWRLQLEELPITT